MMRFLTEIGDLFIIEQHTMYVFYFSSHKKIRRVRVQNEKWPCAALWNKIVSGQISSNDGLAQVERAMGLMKVREFREYT